MKKVIDVKLYDKVVKEIDDLEPSFRVLNVGKGSTEEKGIVLSSMY